MTNQSDTPPKTALTFEKPLAVVAAWYVLPIIAFTLLTALGAMVRIPLPGTPVPVTLQTLFVVLGGLLLGGTRGGLSQVLYVMWGVSGAPLFAGGASGLPVITGATGGYLMGFIISAWLVGNRIQNRNTILDVILWSTAGGLLILACGWLWLAVAFAPSPAAAFKMGVLPFLVGDILKTIMAVGAYEAYAPLKKRFI